MGGWACPAVVGGRVIPVDTTALRILESAAAGGRLQAFRGETVASASTERQRVATATLGTLAAVVAEEGLASAAILLVCHPKSLAAVARAA